MAKYEEIGPYSDYSAAHERALKEQHKGLRSIRIDKVRGKWVIRGSRTISRDTRSVPLKESKKGDLVAFNYRGFHVLGKVKRVLKNGTRTVQITEAGSGFEDYMAQTIDENITVDVHP